VYSLTILEAKIHFSENITCFSTTNVIVIVLLLLLLLSVAVVVLVAVIAAAVVVVSSSSSSCSSRRSSSTVVFIVDYMYICEHAVYKYNIQRPWNWNAGFENIGFMTN
jgi:hypothetical protein